MPGMLFLHTLLRLRHNSCSQLKPRCGERQMKSHDHADECLTAVTADGMLIIHSYPPTLSWIPHDVINDAYNFGGIVTVGTFDSFEDAKHAAKERYPVSFDEWRVSDVLPFEMSRTRTEIHTPDIVGHKVLRHGIRWK